MCDTPWKIQGQKPRPIEIPHNIFFFWKLLVTPRLFLFDSWNFHIPLLQYALKFHVLNSPCLFFFSGIAQYVTINTGRNSKVSLKPKQLNNDAALIVLPSFARHFISTYQKNYAKLKFSFKTNLNRIWIITNSNQPDQANEKYEYGHLDCWYIKLSLFKRF